MDYLYLLTGIIILTNIMTLLIGAGNCEELIIDNELIERYKSL